MRTRGFRRAFNWASMMPRLTSFWGNCSIACIRYDKNVRMIYQSLYRIYIFINIHIYIYIYIYTGEPFLHWEKFCQINDTFKRVIGILINWHIPTGSLMRIASYLGLLGAKIWVWFNNIWKKSLCVRWWTNRGMARASIINKADKWFRLHCTAIQWE